jgi:hypothetical protein
MSIGIYQGMTEGETNIFEESQIRFYTPGYSREHYK